MVAKKGDAVGNMAPMVILAMNAPAKKEREAIKVRMRGHSHRGALHVLCVVCARPHEFVDVVPPPRLLHVPWFPCFASRTGVRGYKAKEREDTLTNRVGMRNVFAALSEACRGRHVPLVGHNCLCDVLFMMNTFQDGLPEDLAELKRQVHELFPHMYDTKTLAEATDMFSRTALDALYEVCIVCFFARVCVGSLLYAQGACLFYGDVVLSVRRF